MHATTVAIDLVKEVFELAFADASGRVLERKRLSRKAFTSVLDNQGPLRVLMEACGSAHYWGRRFAAQGHDVKLIPVRDVRPYVRRNKTDRTDVAGMLEGAPPRSGLRCLPPWRMATTICPWRCDTPWPGNWKGLPAWSGKWQRSRIACTSSRSAMSPHIATSRSPASGC